MFLVKVKNSTQSWSVREEKKNLFRMVYLYGKIFQQGYWMVT